MQNNSEKYRSGNLTKMSHHPPPYQESLEEDSPLANRLRRAVDLHVSPIRAKNAAQFPQDPELAALAEGPVLLVL
jgi:hypothetical protein